MPGPETTAMETIRVLLVDDQSGVRAGLKMALSLETDIDIVGEAGDGPEALAETALRRPDVVVLDYEMPGMDGPAVIEALKQVAALGRRARLVVAGARVLPVSSLRPVVELRRALEVQVDQALDAIRDADHAVLGLVVGRGAPVARLALVLVMPRPDRQEVVDDQPARARHPRGLPGPDA